jgi:hypothetical protein
MDTYIEGERKMSTYTWEYGSAGSGLHFTIVYDDVAQTFTVTSLEGSFDLNALWFSDGADGGEGDTTLTKKDNSLNMNGTGEEWDDYEKLSSTGLGPEGEAKYTFISDQDTEPTVFNLSDFDNLEIDFDPEVYTTLGVRATSVNGDGSIKLVDSDPEVSSGNVAPVANDDTFAVSEEDVETASSDGKLLVGNVITGNDSDGDGDALSVTDVTAFAVVDNDPDLDVTVSAASADGDEVARFELSTDFGEAYVAVSSNGNVHIWSDAGEDPFKQLGISEKADITFTYTVSDGNGGTDTADVTITVGGSNDSPTASDDVWILSNATTATLSPDAVLLNDTDVDGDPLTIQSVADSTEGRDVTLNGDDTITYTNSDTSLGADGFDYIVSDGNGGTDTGAVDITFVETKSVNPGRNDIEDLSSEEYDASYIDGKVGNDELTGTTVEGATGLDILVGSDGADSLFGNGGDDELYGGADNDHLYGGAGADLLSGGSGNDDFDWVAGDMADTDDTHFDTIIGWGDTGDKLDISDLLADFGYDPDANTLSQWVSITNDGTNTTVAIDADGAGGDADYANLVLLQNFVVTDVNAFLNDKVIDA